MNPGITQSAYRLKANVTQYLANVAQGLANVAQGRVNVAHVQANVSDIETNVSDIETNACDIETSIKRQIRAIHKYLQFRSGKIPCPKTSVELEVHGD